ncbi:MAG TPA: BTAD domain-containing putative transcriptional regulator [candidate division Zixibacteria bacterium]|nr:BTAD domain-containing putative transcriptional regulator [candidate division Zixibacteria bacterium]
MAGLSILLLGPFQVTLDGNLVSDFESAKVKGLLAYLVAEAERPHARETLAGLLWPDYPNRSAFNNLRSALSNLRQTIGDRHAQPSFLLITRDTLQFNIASDYSLDIADLQHTSTLSIEHLEQAVAACQGSFLEGFSLADSTPFEDWMLYMRERVNRQLMDSLTRLASHYEGCGDYQRVIDYTRRELELEPWHEEAHRQLMRALAFSGQRTSALAQYESCSRVLMQELGVAPERETTELYERIRGDMLKPTSTVGQGESEPPYPGIPPFKGMTFFDEVDAKLFCGREKLTAQLVNQVSECLSPEVVGNRIVTVIGASGSGKSSVVRAGLIPAIKGRKSLEDTYKSGGGASHLPFSGPIHVITPTVHPLEALAVSLTYSSGSVAETAALIDDLARDPRSLHLAAARITHSNGVPQMLVLVDQFEELFSLCHDGNERQAFVDNLLYAACNPGPITVIVVLRADFYAHCAPFENLRQALCERQQYIGAMNSEELRRAITEPARSGGWTFEPGLVDLLIRDVNEEPGALPLLSHALLVTWRRRRGRTMTLAGYQESGGVQGAIAKTAETIFNQLTPDQQIIARRIFTRLTALGEDATDENLPELYTRRRAELVELIPRPEESDQVQLVLNKLADARLVTTFKETVEVAHEALIHEWARLRSWLNENREALRLHRQITVAVHEWERLDRDTDALFRGARLAQAEEWANENPGAMSAQELHFIEASLAERQAQQLAEETRRQRELEAAQALAETETQRAEEQAQAAGQLRRRAIWLALALGALTVLLLTATGLGLLANRNAKEAQELARLATSRELAAAAVNNLQLDPERSVLLSLQALASADTLEARNSLHKALPALHVLRTIPAHVGGAPGVAVSPDGKRLASTGVDNTVKIWEFDSGELLLTLPGDEGGVGFDVVYSPDGTQLAATMVSEVILWDAESGERLFSLPGATDGTVRRLDFSPDGERLAVASMDGLPRVWDLATQVVLFSLAGHEYPCEAIAYSPNGKQLATGDVEGTIKIWDAGGGQELLSFDHGGGIHGVAFSPDGKQLAVASDNALLGIWNATNGEPLFSLPVRSGIYDVEYMPDGTHLAATHQDGTTTIWDPLSGQQLLSLAGHVSTVISTAASPDNNLLVTGGYDGMLKIWDINPGRELLTISAHDDQVYDIAYSPDGLRLATAGFDGKAKLWDPATGLLVRSLPPENASSGLSSLDLSQDGEVMALGSWDGTVYVTDMATEQVRISLPAHMAPIIGMDLSADGKQLATAGWDGTAKIWDLDSGEPVLTLFSRDDLGTNLAISGLALSLDGKYLYTGGDDDFVHQWDAKTGEELGRFSGDGLDLYGLAVSPDGRLLAAGRQDGAVLVWDIASGEQLHQLAAHAGLVLRLAFSEDGSKLASVGFDSLAKVWDAASGQELVTLFGTTGNVFGAAFSPDGKHLATAGGDGTVRIYTLEMDELIELAHGRVTRTLTVEECLNYLRTEQCPAIR